MQFSIEGRDARKTVLDERDGRQPAVANACRRVGDRQVMQWLAQGARSSMDGPVILSPTQRTAIKIRKRHDTVGVDRLLRRMHAD
jgi:hypothetical protein